MSAYTRPLGLVSRSCPVPFLILYSRPMSPRNKQRPGQVRGQRHPAAKLTWAAVRKMRERLRLTADGVDRHADGHLLSMPDCAERRRLIRRWLDRYGVSQSALWQAIHGVTWREP
jgi:hypothetical protein